jgi:hypothetical protein
MSNFPGGEFMSLDILSDQKQNHEPLAHAESSVRFSLGIEPETPVKVTIPIPKVFDEYVKQMEEDVMRIGYGTAKVSIPKVSDE